MSTPPERSAAGREPPPAVTLGLFDPNGAGAQLGSAIDEVDEALQDLLRRVRRGLGVSSIDFAALNLLDRRTRQGRSTRVRDLTQQLGVSSATATMISHRLEAAGLVRREPDEHDHRGTCLVLEADAEQRVLDLLDPVRDGVAGLVGSMEPDGHRQLVDLLARFGSAIRAGD